MGFISGALLCVLAGAFVVSPHQALAQGSITLQWVETDVSLHRDG